MGVSKNRGPQYSALNSDLRTVGLKFIRTCNKAAVTPQILATFPGLVSSPSSVFPGLPKIEALLVTDSIVRVPYCVLYILPAKHYSNY